MSYADVMYLSYGELERVRAGFDAYRGKLTRAWPLGDRNYSHRHFRYDDGTGVYSLYLGNLDSVDQGLMRPQNEQQEHYARRALIGRVHPDNSLEFLCDSSQGTFMFLESAIRGSRVTQVKAKGGGVMSGYIAPHAAVEHPLFHGFRVNLDTLKAHPSTHYYSLHPTLKRKESKEYVKKFDEFLRVFNVFLEPLEKSGFVSVVEDISEEFHVLSSMRDDPSHMSGEFIRQMAPGVIEALTEERRYADAAVMTAVMTAPWQMNLHRLNQLSRIDWLKQNIRRYLKSKNFIESMIRSKDDLFKYEEIEEGKPLKHTKWRVRTICDMQEVNRI